MSFKAIEWAFGIQELRPTERLILVYLAYRSNSKQECWPSTKRMLKDCDIGNGTLFRALDNLEKKHLINRQHRYKTGGLRRRSSKYTLNLHRGTPIVGQANSQSGITNSQSGMTLESSSESSLNLKTATTSLVALISDHDMKDVEAQILSTDFVLGADMKLADMMKDFQIKPTLESVLQEAKGKHNSYSGSRLQVLWRRLHLVFDIQVFFPPISSKEAGQFGHLVKTFEGQSDVGLVMVTVISDWLGFGKFLKGQGLVVDFPDNPHVGFFLKHAPMAWQFHKDHDGKETKSSTPSLKKLTLL